MAYHTYHKNIKSLILSNAQRIIARIKAGEAYNTIEKEIGAASGYIKKILELEGLNPPKVKRGRRPGFKKEKQATPVTPKKISTYAYVKKHAQEIELRHDMGETYEAISKDLGIETKGYLKALLGRFLPKPKAEKTHRNFEVLEDFSPEFKARLGKPRCRRFFGMLNAAADEYGCQTDDEKRAFFKRLLQQTTARRNFEDVCGIVEFNALMLTAAVCSKDEEMIERFRLRFKEPLTPVNHTKKED